MDQPDKYCLIIGSMKCGTTALFEYLQRSGSMIKTSSIKDTKFFVHPNQKGNWDKGIDWYRSHFLPIQENQWLVEASTHYTKHPYFPGVAERIRATSGLVRLVYLVRNPLQRVLSHFFHNCFVDKETLEINDIIEKQSNKYLYYSNYALQLEQYYEYFEPEDILVINVVDDACYAHSLDRLSRFLQLNQPFAQDHFFPANTLQDNYEDNAPLCSDRRNTEHRSHPLDAMDLAWRAGLKVENMYQLAEICAGYGRALRELHPGLDYEWMTGNENTNRFRS